MFDEKTVQAMTQVLLQTADGEHVATARTLPYEVWPEVMLWGERVFVKTDLAQVSSDGKAAPIYREGFMNVVLYTDEYGPVFNRRGSTKDG